MAEKTLFQDRNGRDIRLGDVVRAEIKAPFSETHGAWADYEITKAPGGYVMLYITSASGCQLPFGYTGTYLHEFETDLLPSLKSLVFSERSVVHPALEVVDCTLSYYERRALFAKESEARRRTRDKT